jgi:tetrahydromethanopterin S-methyltransferase subunit B
MGYRAISAVATWIVVAAASGAVAQDTSSSILSKVDHLIYATPDLDTTVAEMEKLLGVRAAPGGRQPGRGTRNALISLGANSYLEIVGPDPKQPRPTHPPWWLQDLKKPRIVAWAAKGTDLESLRAKAVDNGVPLGEVISGNRQRPDGVILTWRMTSPRNPVADGVVPFFIDWGESEHPSRTSPHGVQLVALRAVHPDDRRVQDMLRRLNVDLPVTHGSSPRIIASLEGPLGRVELR